MLRNGIGSFISNAKVLTHKKALCELMPPAL